MKKSPKKKPSRSPKKAPPLAAKPSPTLEEATPTVAPILEDLEGDLDLQEIKQKIEDCTYGSVLFLCTGNYYRSRYAEYYFNAVAQKKLMEWRAYSLGLALERGANNVGPVSRYTLERLAKHKIRLIGDLPGPLPANEEEIRNANFVVALDQSEHRPLMDERFPDLAPWIQYWQVADIDRAQPDDALALVEQQVWEMIQIIEEAGI